MTAAVPAPRSPGRPMDTDLTERFLNAGIRLIADRGLHKLNADVLAADVHGGKAGFYRRWPSMDHFLAAIARRITAEPVAYWTPRTVRTDLASLVQHQVTSDRGRVTCAVLSRLPHSDVLLDAWVAVDGPGGRLLAEIAHIPTNDARLAPWLLFIQRGVQRIVAGQREHLLVHGYAADDQVVLGEVDDLLAAVDRRAGRSAQ